MLDYVTNGNNLSQLPGVSILESVYVMVVECCCVRWVTCHRHINYYIRHKRLDTPRLTLEHPFASDATPRMGVLDRPARGAAWGTHHLYQ
jgi:hypothetical protein